MSQIVDATFEDGVFKPDSPLDLPPHSRVPLVVEVDGDARNEADRYGNSPERKAAWERLKAFMAASTYDSGGFKMTLDELHERR